jgi:hypothetical protein
MVIYHQIWLTHPDKSREWFQAKLGISDPSLGREPRKQCSGKSGSDLDHMMLHELKIRPIVHHKRKRLRGRWSRLPISQERREQI